MKDIAMTVFTALITGIVGALTFETIIVGLFMFVVMGGFIIGSIILRDWLSGEFTFKDGYTKRDIIKVRKRRSHKQNYETSNITHSWAMLIGLRLRTVWGS